MVAKLDHQRPLATVAQIRRIAAAVDRDVHRRRLHLAGWKRETVITAPNLVVVDGHRRAEAAA